MDWSQIIVAAGTLAIAYFTWLLVKGQLSISREQVKVQLYLQLRKEFEGGLVGARKALASQLLKTTPTGELHENVMNFFEDMGMLFRRGYLDREMVWDTFGYYAVMWWGACKDWVVEERSEDQTFFTDFEFSGTDLRRRCEALQKDKNRASTIRIRLKGLFGVGSKSSYYNIKERYF